MLTTIRDLLLLGDEIRLIVAIVLPTVIWVSKNCAGFSGKTQLLYAISISATSCISNWSVAKNSQSETDIKIICALATWLTVYLIYVKFKDTNSRQEDSLGVVYLILFAAIAAIAAAIFSNGFSTEAIESTFLELLEFKFNYIDVLRSFGLFIEAVAILPQLFMIYRDKTFETRKIALYYIFAMWAYRGVYVISALSGYEFTCPDLYINSSACLQYVIFMTFVIIYVWRKVPHFKFAEEANIEVYI